MTERMIRNLVCRWVESGKLNEATAKRLLEKILKFLRVTKKSDTFSNKYSDEGSENDEML